jgi:hypothetical protein
MAQRIVCNLCGCSALELFLDLGKHPLADTFLSPALSAGPETYFPLKMIECRECGHVFTGYHIPPELRYIENEYSYDSSNSPVSIAHFEEFADDIIVKYEALFNSGRPRCAIDIGSNVGTLLKAIAGHGVPVVGIEPSPNIAAIARENGIPTISNLFGASVLEDELLSNSVVDVIASTNVVNHIDDLQSMMQLIDQMGSPKVLLAFEVPYLIDLVEARAFDTVYHEHVNYFSLRSIGVLLERAGFGIIHASKISYMGGSIRVFAARLTAADVWNRLPKQRSLLEEAEEGFFSNGNWREEFRSDVVKIKHGFLAFLYKEIAKGKRFCCIGAATKGNTFLNYCRVDRDAIGVSCDVSKLKVGKILPGSGIPILHDDAIGNDWDYGIVLPWNIGDFLRAKFQSRGLSLVFPIQNRIEAPGGRVEALY